MIGLVLLFPKHPLLLEFFNFSSEKFTFELGNLKWENGDFVDFKLELDLQSIGSSPDLQR